MTTEQKQFIEKAAAEYSQNHRGILYNDTLYIAFKAGAATTLRSPLVREIIDSLKLAQRIECGEHCVTNVNAPMHTSICHTWAEQLAAYCKEVSGE